MGHEVSAMVSSFLPFKMKLSNLGMVYSEIILAIVMLVIICKEDGKNPQKILLAFG